MDRIGERGVGRRMRCLADTGLIGASGKVRQGAKVLRNGSVEGGKKGAKGDKPKTSMFNHEKWTDEYGS